MLMEQNARRLGRQSPEPNRNQKTGETMMEQNARIPGTKESWWNKNTPELLEPEPSRNQERMMEQGARGVGRQAPEP